MTELDKFEPEGEPIHPFDLYELINKKAVMRTEWQPSPSAVDEADYRRNRDKIGTVHIIDGKKYFETTSIEAVTKNIA